MKFHTKLDVQRFLVEVNRIDLLGEAEKDFKPTNELIGTFIRKRQRLISGLKDFRKSQDSKSMWRRYRADIMRGIKRFHKSTEGKRFHRNLGRFIAGRTFMSGPSGIANSMKRESLNILEKADIIKALYSVSSHLMIELEYFHPVSIQVGLEHFVNQHITEIHSVVNKVLKDENLTDENRSLILLLTEATAIIKSFAKKSGKSEDEVEKIWKEIKSQLKSKGKVESDKDFFQNLVGILKIRLRVK